MAHEITNSDNLFSTRKPTWHGMGTIFENYPTREEAQAIAHPWEPVAEPLYTSYMDMNDDEVRQGYFEVPGYQAVTRSDNSNVIGVVSDSYQPVTNNEMWDIAEALEKNNPDVMYETGGSLKGGSKVWLLLKLKEPLMVPGDPNGASVPYYSLQNSHDGSGAFRGQATMTRIVCANTAHAADLDSKARGTEFTFRHTKNVSERLEQAQQALMAWRQGLDDLQEKYAYLMGLKVSAEQTTDFEEMFFPIDQSLMSDRQINNMLRIREDWHDILMSPNNEGVENTAYGLVQSVVEYAEHGRYAQSQETRFKRTYLDRNRITSEAVRMAEKVAA